MTGRRTGPLLRRIIVYTHRWLGIALGALFIGWFVSGVVLMYVGMPRLAPGERLAHLPSLDFTTASIGPDQAVQALSRSVDGLRLAMVRGRPVYHMTSRRSVAAVYADTGEPVAPISAETAVAQARVFAPAHASTIRYASHVTDPDQWTLEFARQLPMHRISVGDADDTQLYVSEATGEIVLETTASGRRWAYPGAILHWIYLTPVRRHAERWAQFIIWTSVVGTVMAIVGLVWGMWRFSPRAVFRLKRVHRHSPYAGWMWWHHYAGLVFGVATVTWIFSGLLSMDPWDWHPSTTPTPAQRAAFTGGPLAVDGLGVEDLRQALRAIPDAREAEILRSGGRRWLATATRAVPLDPGTTTLPLTESTVRDAARKAMPGSPTENVTSLTEYDAYYYDRNRELPLPVFRIRYQDPVRTWLYVDATRGTVVRKEERLTRLNRWLYHGLHSLDFPFLYYRRPLWDIVVIALSLGGLVLAAAAITPTWRRARRTARKVRRAAGWPRPT